jgi:hypothetical protein
MSTKYELATELRQLTRGMKAGPICRMKKHELEAEIDRIKVLKQIKPSTDYPPAKPGPTGPRRLGSAVVSFDDVDIKVPQAPAEKVVEPVRMKKKETAVEGPASPGPRMPVRAAVHTCTCQFCPKRSAHKDPTVVTL